MGSSHEDVIKLLTSQWERFRASTSAGEGLPWLGCFVFLSLSQKVPGTVY